MNFRSSTYLPFAMQKKFVQESFFHSYSWISLTPLPSSIDIHINHPLACLDKTIEKLQHDDNNT